MFYVKLFTNKNQWKSPNEITQLECKGYSPIKILNMAAFAGGKNIKFNLEEHAEVYGCYVTSTEGDLVFHQRFADAPFMIDDKGGTIVVEFSK
jgi:hypothetical protein